MKHSYRLLLFALCFALLIPSVSADNISSDDVLPVFTSEESSDSSPETTVSDESNDSVSTDSLEFDTPSLTSEIQSPASSETSTSDPENSTVTEVTPAPDYTNSLQQILETLQNTEFATQTIAGFLLFFVVCVLCYFCYKFFKIFI